MNMPSAKVPFNTRTKSKHGQQITLCALVILAVHLLVEGWTGALQVQSCFQTVQTVKQLFFWNAPSGAK